MLPLKDGLEKAMDRLDYVRIPFDPTLFLDSESGRYLLHFLAKHGTSLSLDQGPFVAGGSITRGLLKAEGVSDIDVFCFGDNWYPTLEAFRKHDPRYAVQAAAGYKWLIAGGQSTTPVYTTTGIRTINITAGSSNAQAHTYPSIDPITGDFDLNNSVLKQVDTEYTEMCNAFGHSFPVKPFRVANNPSRSESYAPFVNIGSHEVQVCNIRAEGGGIGATAIDVLASFDILNCAFATDGKEMLISKEGWEATKVLKLVMNHCSGRDWSKHRLEQRVTKYNTLGLVGPDALPEATDTKVEFEP